MTPLRILRAGLGGGLTAAGAMVIVMIFVRGLGGFAPDWWVILLVLGGAALIGALLQGSLVTAGGEVAGAIVAPSGKSTPYTPTFSHIEAMQIRGDLDGAERAWDEARASHPDHALVWVKSADFHLRLRGDALTARGQYQHVRDLSHANADLVRYASQKLIDIHLGPLADEGRALVELRRLIDRFPGTREAEDARVVLARLKAERASG